MSKTKKYGPILLKSRVREEWIDYNGHMNMAYYVLLFDQALTNFLDGLDLGFGYAQESGNSLFALENHVTYQHELRQGDPVCVHFQLLDANSKFIHYFMQLFHQDHNSPSATMEQISLNVNMTSRCPTRFLAPAMEKIMATLIEHEKLERPREIGRSIAIRRHGPTRLQNTQKDTSENALKDKK